MSFNLISRLLSIALRTGSAFSIFSFIVFSLIGNKIQLEAASAVTDLDSLNEGPLSPKISPSPIWWHYLQMPYRQDENQGQFFRTP